MIKRTAQAKYDAQHRRRFIVDCFDTTEKDIISHLDRQDNKARYIKNLIRADIKKESE